MLSAVNTMQMERLLQEAQLDDACPQAAVATPQDDLQTSNMMKMQSLLAEAALLPPAQPSQPSPSAPAIPVAIEVMAGNDDEAKRADDLDSGKLKAAAAVVAPSAPPGIRFDDELDEPACAAPSAPPLPPPLAAEESKGEADLPAATITASSSATTSSAAGVTTAAQLAAAAAFQARTERTAACPEGFVKKGLLNPACKGCGLSKTDCLAEEARVALAETTAAVAAVAAKAAAAAAEAGMPSGAFLLAYDDTLVTSVRGAGVVHFLGTGAGTQPWANPAVAGAIVVTRSSEGAGNAADAAGGVSSTNTTAKCCTADEAGAWFQIDLLEWEVLPDKYALQHGSAQADHHARNWRLEASPDGLQWVVLRDHRSERALGGNHHRRRGFGAASWDLPGPGALEQRAKGQYFRSFRVVQTSTNAFGNNVLHLGGFEVWGGMRRRNNA